MVLLDKTAYNEKYSFYYKGEKIAPVKVSAGEFDALAGSLRQVRELEIYKWAKADGVTAGDYVDIDRVVASISQDLPKYVQAGEGITACCFTYYQDPKTGTTDYPILVKKEDLRLEQGDAWLKDNSFCEQMAPGYIYYDSSAVRTGGNNARGMFEGGDEFEMVDPYAFSGAPGVVPVRVGGDIRYLDLAVGARLKAKIVIKDAYRGKNGIVFPNEKITGSDVIGYPTNHPNENAKGCYDVAVFFTGDAFLRDKSRVHHAKTTYYTISEGTPVYTRQEQKAGGYSFSNEGKSIEQERTGRAEDEKTDDAGLTYYGFKGDDGVLFYIPGNAPGIEERNYLNWEEHFTLDGTDSDGDLICDIDREVRKIESLSAGQDGYQLPDGKITRRELAAFFKQRHRYRELVEGFRRYVCRHPLEWDKTKYDEAFKNKLRLIFNLSGERFRLLQERAEKLDIWDGIKQLDDLKENGTARNNFWFAHPVYFLNHLDKAGLLDQSFNPYEGKTIKRSDPKKGSISVKVIDNPGFAPKYKKQAWNDYEGDIFKNPATGESFAVPTGIFGQWYADFSRYHEGVDFRGEKGAPIYSFIHAKVVEYGWTDMAYGQIVLFANTNGKGMYMIAHLDRIADRIEKDVQVSPGDIVGYVGNSGGNFAEHLHVSYYDVQYDQSRERTYYIGKDTNTKLTFTGIIGYNKESERNPFWHDSGSCASKNATNAQV
jgi:hypothetical protein